MTCRRRSRPAAATAARSRGAVSGNAGSCHTDVVTASGTDDDGNDVSDDDDATVTITDVDSSILVTKTADSDLTAGAGRQRELLGDGQEHVGRGLGDDHEPDGRRLRRIWTARAPVTCRSSWPPGRATTARSAVRSAVTRAAATPTSSPPLAPTTTATRVAGDDDAAVTITNVQSSIAVTKTASPTSIQEPGGNATFSVSVKNTSAVDTVTITSLTDDVYGNLDGKGTCDVPQHAGPGRELRLLVHRRRQRRRRQHPHRRRHRFRVRR